MSQQRKPHVVSAKLADGTRRTYVYAYRGGPRIDGMDADQAAEAVAGHRARAHRSAVLGRIRREQDNLDLRAMNAVASKLVRNGRVRADRRGLDFLLSTTLVVDMLRNQQMRCAVSGLPFDLSANIDGEFTRNPFGPSIDRRDVRKGYAPENVRLVLVAVNFAMNEWGEGNFRKICDAVAALGDKPISEI